MALTHLRWYLIGFLCVLGIAVVLILHARTTARTTTMLAKEIIQIGTSTVAVEIAATPRDRQQGLSGRSSLLTGTGMLFVFDTPGEYGFWMKDMLFAIDMVFVDEKGLVVTVDRNISPATYPQAYYPSKFIKYVIELPAGYSDQHGITQGTRVVLP